MRGYRATVGAYYLWQVAPHVKYMKKLIRTVDEARGILQVTTVDERWYVRSVTGDITGLPQYLYVPSVTWICGFYPKGIEFYKWLANKGWDESQAIKNAAGDKGSKVHYAITDLLAGKEVKMDAKYKNPSTEQDEELSLEEWECLVSFANWFEKTKPEIIVNETVVWNDEYGYAGTIDFVCKIGEEYYIVDFKTGQNVWPEYELQVSAYKHAHYDKSEVQLPEDVDYKLAILQIGYKRNKAGWKFTEVEDKFDLFLAARQIWQHENPTTKPQQKDYPLSLQVTTPVPEGDTAEVTPNK